MCLLFQRLFIHTLEVLSLNRRIAKYTLIHTTFPVFLWEYRLISWAAEFCFQEIRTIMSRNNEGKIDRRNMIIISNLLLPLIRNKVIGIKRHWNLSSWIANKLLIMKDGVGSMWIIFELSSHINFDSCQNKHMIVWPHESNNECLGLASTWLHQTRVKQISYWLQATEII